MNRNNHKKIFPYFKYIVSIRSINLHYKLLKRLKPEIVNYFSEKMKNYILMWTRKGASVHVEFLHPNSMSEAFLLFQSPSTVYNYVILDSDIDYERLFQQVITKTRF